MPIMLPIILVLFGITMTTIGAVTGTTYMVMLGAPSIPLGVCCGALIAYLRVKGGIPPLPAKNTEIPVAIPVHPEIIVVYTERPQQPPPDDEVDIREACKI